jgi:rubrerythrin
MFIWLAAEIYQFTEDKLYLENNKEMIRFLEHSQLENGELQYIFGYRPHFQSYQYNSYQFLDLAHYYQLIQDEKVWLILKKLIKFLEGGEVEISYAFPAGVIGSTLENLQASAAGEKHEWDTMYPGFAKVAKEEGFNEIAAVWEYISVAEKQHEKRYLDLAENILAERVFKRDRPVVWRCLNCGYIHTGETAVKICPACIHPQAHFELLGENW